MSDAWVCAEGMRSDGVSSASHRSTGNDREILLIINCRLGVKTFLGSNMTQRRIGSWLL